jgi:hypothetical protein
MTDGARRMQDAAIFLRTHVSRALTDGQAGLFVLIAGDEGVSQPELMKKTRTARSNIRLDLRRLAQGYTRWDGRVFRGFGLIRLFYDLNNSKAIVCYLTEKGASVLDGLHRALKKEDEKVTETSETQHIFTTPEVQAFDDHLHGRITRREYERKQARIRAERK